MHYAMPASHSEKGRGGPWSMRRKEAKRLRKSLDGEGFGLKLSYTAQNLCSLSFFEDGLGRKCGRSGERHSRLPTV